MKSASVRTRLTVWNVVLMASALLILGLGISYGARKSLVAAVDKDLTSRATRLAIRVEHLLNEHPNDQRGIIVSGVEKGAPKIRIPGVRDTINTLQIGPGEYEALWNPQPPATNDPTRSPFRTRILRLDGKTSGGEAPYDVEAFLAAKSGEENTKNILVESEPSRFEPARLLTLPVMHNGQVARVIQYPQPLAGTYQALSGITWTLLTVLPLILVVATFGGFFLTGRTLKPVREITDTASQIGAESLAGRLEVKGNDEFSRLAQTFNGMLERLQGAFVRMEQAVDQQRRFTADASHELRTPLTVIKANTSLALKGERSVDDYKRSLVAVNAAADSMGRLVNDLLLLARSDNGRLELQREPLCLKPILKEAIASVSRPGTAAIKLQMNDEGQEVLGDGHSLGRVFLNLLENATRYTPETGSITVHQHTEGGEVVISVQDTGVGIAPEHLPHITDRFYRVDEARARAEGGNGLGLSICASIVESHGGSMKIDSTVGEGTKVTVRLPSA